MQSTWQMVLFVIFAVVIDHRQRHSNILGHFETCAVLQPFLKKYTITKLKLSGDA